MRHVIPVINRNMVHSQVIGNILCWLFHCISSWTVLLLYRSSFQHHLIRCPRIICWLLKGYVWTYQTLWLSWPSRLFLEITPPDSKESWLSSNRNCQRQPSKRQQYCYPNYMCNFRTNNLCAYSLAFWSCLYFKAKINGKKMTHGSYSRNFNLLGSDLPYLSPD